MSTTTTKFADSGDPVDAFAELRQPFPAEMIGKLPRITCPNCRNEKSKVCGNHQKDACADCHNYMTRAHMHLDYVGHAAVTDRLLRVDPFWTWEPVAWNSDGLPLIKDGCLWIRLTVAGHTRLGVGTADGKSGADAVKEMIGDALRNAAMRFGVALDLWSKEDLHAAPPEPIAEESTIAELVARMNALGEADRKQCKAMFVDAFGRPESLRASQVQLASDMIAGFEQSADERDPTGDTDAPGAAPEDLGGQSGATQSAAGGGDIGPEPPADQPNGASSSTTEPEGDPPPAGQEPPEEGAQPADGDEGEPPVPPSSPDAGDCDLQDLAALMGQTGLSKTKVLNGARRLAKANELDQPRMFDDIGPGRPLDLLVEWLGDQDDDPPPSGNGNGSKVSHPDGGGVADASSEGTPADHEPTTPAASVEQVAAGEAGDAPKKGTQKGRYYAQHKKAAARAGVDEKTLRERLVSIVTGGHETSAAGWPDNAARWGDLADMAQSLIEDPKVELYQRATGEWTIGYRPGAAGHRVPRHRPRSAA